MLFIKHIISFKRRTGSWPTKQTLTFNIMQRRNHQPRIRLVSDSFIIRFHDASTAAADSIIISRRRPTPTSVSWYIVCQFTSLIRFRYFDSDSDWSVSERQADHPRLATSVSVAAATPHPCCCCWQPRMSAGITTRSPPQTSSVAVV